MRARSTVRSRLLGVDAARAVAVAGMVMVHFGPNPIPDAGGGVFYGLAHGRASVLFALLAGVGVALLFRGRIGERPGLLRGRLALRGALLLPLGLWLQGLDHSALVILQYYAVYFLFAALALSLPDEWLISLAAAFLVIGPVVFVLCRFAAPGLFMEDPAILGDPIGQLVPDVLLSGAYPLITWAAPLLFGMWLGRRDLSRIRWVLLGGGLVVAAAAALASGWLVAEYGEPLVGAARFPENDGFANLLSAEPHSQMPLWILGAIGSSCAVLGGMLLLADLLPRLTWPLAATGQLALTVYVGHLLLLHAAGELVERETVPDATLSVATFMLVAMAICSIWRLVFPRGPLEAILAAPWKLVENVVVRYSAGKSR
ncbi:MAG: DUF418 domain-containing protein [Rubrobacteraceae bacterium]